VGKGRKSNNYDAREGNEQARENRSNSCSADMYVRYYSGLGRRGKGGGGEERESQQWEEARMRSGQLDPKCFQ